MNNLKNKVVYITGGTKGIGFGVAKCLIEAGMRVAISGRNLETAENAVAELGNKDQVLAMKLGFKMPKGKRYKLTYKFNF